MTLNLENEYVDVFKLVSSFIGTFRNSRFMAQNLNILVVYAYYGNIIRKKDKK